MTRSTSDSLTRTVALTLSVALCACSAPRSGVITENFDRSVRAQDDLFRFVNGAWLKRTEIPADKSNYGTFIALADKARADVRAIIAEVVAEGGAPGTERRKVADLYNSVLDTARLDELGVAPLKPFLEQIGRITDKAALADWFGQAVRAGLDAPVAAYVSYDAKNPTRYLAHITQSRLGLPDRDYYLKDGERYETTRAGYKKHMERLLALTNPSVSADKIAKGAASVWAIERDLAEGQWSRTDRRDRLKTYTLVAPAELAAKAPGFAWDRFLHTLGLAGQTELILRETTYLAAFDAVLAKHSLEAWKAYCTWVLVTGTASGLSTEIDAEYFALFGTLLEGTPTQPPRWQRAVDRVNSVLGEAVGKLYVARHFRPEAKARMSVLVEALRDAFEVTLTDLDWMSPETRTKALDKLRKFRPKIGYPDQWKDYSALDIRAGDLVGNMHRASLWSWQRRVDRLGGPVDREEWFMTPQRVNAYYNSAMNEIVFPAAILQPPFFDLEADDAVNFGAIGAVIGHEMGHGFDDQGSRSDGDGVLRNWWTDADRAAFEARTARLVQQFAAFEVLGEHVNGKLTLGENIGDLGGLTIAWRAWQKSLGGSESPVLDGFTGAQRFFIGWAQVWARKYRDAELRRRLNVDSHSPSEFRTNGPVANIPGFAEAFGLKPGDKLYVQPADRVSIW